MACPDRDGGKTWEISANFIVKSTNLDQSGYPAFNGPEWSWDPSATEQDLEHNITHVFNQVLGRRGPLTLKR